MILIFIVVSKSMEIIEERPPLLNHYHQLNHQQTEFKADFDSFVSVISSERLNKDVESLMNSSFWINALKNSRAFGIGTNLYCKFEKFKILTFYFLL